MSSTATHPAQIALPRPAALLRACPAETGAAALWSAGPHGPRLLLGQPGAWLFPTSLAALQEAWDRARADGAVLIGALSYDLGGALEPAAGNRAGGDSGWPDIAFARCDAWLALEGGRWTGPLAPPAPGPEAEPGAFTVGPLRSATGAARYQRDVACIIDRIRAGDVYQVNLAHRLRGSFRGSPRALFDALASAARPWHGAYLEIPGDPQRIICSVSPELFLDYEPGARRLTTRPMKGTRPGGADPGELAAAAKDTAELNMIIDLMRNDLGRSCAFGSIEVTRPRTIERHGAGPGQVLQATATISGTLRADISLLEALAGAFPPGSVTGAPKIQAMRMIGSLEPLARGPYCGAVGALRPDGGASFNVAIRTALLTGQRVGPGAIDGELSWSVGAGVVADSDPAAEWQETLDKAAILASATGATIEA
ncbi:MAG: anthranilate synthase component I family protein [Phycisphaerales bacterium JB039]